MRLFSELPQIGKASWTSLFANRWYQASKPVTLRLGSTWPRGCHLLQQHSETHGLPSLFPSPLVTGISSGVWFWQAQGLGEIQPPTLRRLQPHIHVYGPFYCWLLVLKGGTAVLFENKNQSLRQPWNSLPGKMTGQIFIRLLRPGTGRGLSSPSHCGWQQWRQDVWAPGSLLFSFYGSILSQLLHEERREGTALVASTGFSFFCPRLEICTDSNFVESFEPLWSEFTVYVGEPWL